MQRWARLCDGSWAKIGAASKFVERIKETYKDVKIGAKWRLISY
jgi:hypothetical protein